MQRRLNFNGRSSSLLWSLHNATPRIVPAAANLNGVNCFQLQWRLISSAAAWKKRRRPKVDWSQRKKSLRILKWKKEQLALGNTTSPLAESSEGAESVDALLDSELGAVFDGHSDSGRSAPSRVVSLSIALQQSGGYDAAQNQGHGGDESEYFTMNAAVLTSRIKQTRNAHKVLSTWLRERKLSRFDHINVSATATHLAQRCLDTLPPHQIYGHCMSWGLVRLLRDVRTQYTDFDARHVANVMWALGVFSIGSERGAVHRDLRRCAAAVVKHMDATHSLRRALNLQNMIDILWALCQLQMREHKYYKWLPTAYLKMDTDVAVTSDALSQLALVYGFHRRGRKPVAGNCEMDEETIGNFWRKLAQEFSDDLNLIESQPNQITNVLFALSCAKPPECELLRVSVLQMVERLHNCAEGIEAKGWALLLWSAAASGYQPVAAVCATHALFATQSLCDKVSAQLQQSTIGDAIAILHALTHLSADDNIQQLAWLLITRIKAQLPYSTGLPLRALCALTLALDHFVTAAKLADGQCVEWMTFHCAHLRRGFEAIGRGKVHGDDVLSTLQMAAKWQCLHTDVDLVQRVVAKVQLSKQRYDYASLRRMVVVLSHIRDSLQRRGILATELRQDIEDVIQKALLKLTPVQTAD